MTPPSMRSSLFLRSLLVLVALITPAWAKHAVLPEARLSVSAPQRPLLLSPTQGALQGTFVVKNTGDRAVEPRVTLLSSPSDPRTPAGVVILADRGKLAPGQERRVTVRFVPPLPQPEGPPPSRARTIAGVLEIEGQGVESETLGFSGERSPSAANTFARWTLPLLALVPLLGALVAQILQRIRADERHPRRVALVSFALCAGLALSLLPRFDRALGRLDGNDGFQFIGRVTLSRPLGIELATAVDGSSMGLLVSLTLAALVLAALGERVVLRTTRTWTSMLVLVAGLLTVVVSLDLAVTIGGWAMALFAAASLRSGGTTPASVARGRRLALLALVSTGCLAAFAVYAVSFVGHGFLADGTLVHQSFAHTDLVRASFPSVTRTLLGLPFVAGLFVLLLGAIAPALGLFPLDAFLHDAFEGSESPSASVAFVPAVAVFVLLRWGALVVPEALAWASVSLSVWAAVAAALGALSLGRERRLSALLGVATSTQIALALLGLASLTPQGVLGATTLFSSLPLTIALAGGASSLLAGRAGTDDLSKLGDIANDSKWLGFSLLAGGLAAFALPLSAGSWGVALALVGGMARLPATGLLAGLSLVVLAGHGVARLVSALFGKAPTALRSSSALEPFGGHLPELSRRERWALLPLALVVLALGASPRPLIGLAERASLDVAAFLDEPGPTQIAQLGVSAADARNSRTPTEDADIVAAP